MAKKMEDNPYMKISLKRKEEQQKIINGILNTTNDESNNKISPANEFNSELTQKEGIEEPENLVEPKEPVPEEKDKVIRKSSSRKSAKKENPRTTYTRTGYKKISLDVPDKLYEALIESSRCAGKKVGPFLVDIAIKDMNANYKIYTAVNKENDPKGMNW